ncbi:MAG: hypothetical protein ACLSA6_13860 [Holdemania massiliensis]
MKIRCNEIVTPTGVIDGLVVIENKRIVQIVPAEQITDTQWDQDAEIMLPGLIDIHTHG